MHSLVRLAAEGLSNLRGTPETRQRARSHQLAREAIRKSHLTFHQATESLWYAEAPERYGFKVEVQVFAYEWFVMILSTAGITIDPEWVPRGLAIDLLQRNHHLKYGSFRLMETEAGLSVLLAHLCDSSRYDALRVAEVAETMLTHFQDAVVQLYARDLIIPPYYGRSNQGT